MTKIITRFAPSPTGKLHIGNARAALINWLYAKKNNGKFILRLDDTDKIRSKQEFKDAIFQDLEWLGLNWDESFNQSDRIDIYNKLLEEMKSQGKVYACYETKEELDAKRKMQLSRGMPPKYDRSSLKLNDDQIKHYKNEGRKPHYRFKIEDNEIIWDDMIKGEIRYHGRNLSDPIIIREDGSFPYIFCSCVDDIDSNITHIIRGEDHVSNTAIQIQIFDALGAEVPKFGHLSLIKSKDDKISKRIGGFEIENLKNEAGLEPMSINNFLTFIGTSQSARISSNIDDLIDAFDITTYSLSPTNYMPEELEEINRKLILNYEYSDINDKFPNLEITNDFWEAVRPNLNKLSDVNEWWEICYNPQKTNENLDKELLNIAADCLPKEINLDTWSIWTKKISEKGGKKGKSLFMPLRLALTGKSSGPELKVILPLISRDEILDRLTSL